MLIKKPRCEYKQFRKTLWNSKHLAPIFNFFMDKKITLFAFTGFRISVVGLYVYLLLTGFRISVVGMYVYGDFCSTAISEVFTMEIYTLHSCMSVLL